MDPNNDTPVSAYDQALREYRQQSAGHEAGVSQPFGSQGAATRQPVNSQGAVTRQDNEGGEAASSAPSSGSDRASGPSQPQATQPAAGRLQSAAPHSRGSRWWRFLQHVSAVVSDTLSPLLVPTYAYMIMMWCTQMVSLPERLRLMTMAVVALLTGVLPTAFIHLLKRTGHVSNNAITNRAQRFVPFMFALICYGLTAGYLAYLHAPKWMPAFYLGGGLAVLIAIPVTLRTKISAHCTSISGLLGLVLWLAFHGWLVVQPTLLLGTVIVLTGAVGTARLTLRRHTLGQVVAGTALGATCVFVTMWLMQG